MQLGCFELEKNTDGLREMDDIDIPFWGLKAVPFGN